SQQLGDDLEEGAEPMKWLTRQVLECAPIHLLAGLHEAAVAVDSIDVERAQLCIHLLGWAAVVKVSAVAEIDAVIRRERHQLDVLAEVTTCAGPQVLQQVGRGNDARAGVEGV